MKCKYFIVFSLLLVFVFSSCQGRQSESGSRSGQVTLTLGIWDRNQEAGITTVLRDFTEQTGIRVNVQITPWDQYWTLLEAAATGSVLPDVFWMHSNQVIRYSSNGMLMDLTDRIARSSIANMSNFPNDLVQLYSYNGKNYGIPKDMDTIALWYNRTMFDEANLPYPDDTWNWDTLRDTARKLTTADRFGFLSAISNQEIYYNFIFQNNGWVISDDKKTSGFDDPRTIEAIQFLVDMVREGTSPGLNITAENTGEALFQSGTVAMAFFGSWMFSSFSANENISANCDLVVLPSGRDGHRASVYNGLGWVAASNTRHPEEAWKLLEFFSRQDIQQRLSASGIAISAFNGTGADWANHNTSFNLKAYTDQIPIGVFYPFSRNAVVWHTMTDRLLRDAWLGTRPVDVVCRDIATTMNQMLANE